MMRATAVLLLLAAALPARSLRSGWFVEAALGVSRFAAGDLNARLQAQQRRIDFLYDQGYAAQRGASGGAFSYSLEEPEGSGLRALHDGLPVSLRVGRRLGPRIALFAGLQFLARQRSSWLQRAFRISDLRPDQVTPPGALDVEVGFPEYLLGVQAWVPHLGAAFDLLGGRSWTAGMRLAAGPMFASIRMIESQRARTSEADGYWSEWRQVYDMKGSGTGLALEAAARLALTLAPRLTLLLEAGHAWRSGWRFSGPGSYQYQSRDANAVQDPLRSEWQGEWRTQRFEVRRDWGVLAYTFSGNDLAGGGRFRLDLSGWQLAAGLSLAL